VTTSPFPGIDPYLEDPGIWQSVHATLIINMVAALNRVLPLPYVAVAEEWLRVLPNRQRIRPDVTLDLQAVLMRSYDDGAYSRRIDYRLEPVPPLAPADAVWANSLLTEHGLR
jgi:hypothetical protein